MSARNSRNICWTKRQMGGQLNTGRPLYNSHTYPLCYLYLYRLSSSLPSRRYTDSAQVLNGQRGWARRDDHLPPPPPATQLASVGRARSAALRFPLDTGWLGAPLGGWQSGTERGLSLPSLPYTVDTYLLNGRLPLLSLSPTPAEREPLVSCRVCRSGWVAGGAGECVLCVSWTCVDGSPT